MSSPPTHDGVLSSPRRSYRRAVEEFDLAAASAFLAMDEEGRMNAAEVCCDRHASVPGRIALTHRSTSGQRRDWSYSELKRRSSQFAHVLRGLGVGPGDRVAGLLPRTPELLIVILATWRLGAVYQPLFTAFGPKAIEHRIELAKTRVIVCDQTNRAKLSGIENVPVIGIGATNAAEDFWALTECQAEMFEPVACGADDPFLMMFTSGTTGLPKPMLVPIRAIAAFVAYMRDAVGLEPTERFWNLADPGWAYGLYYAVTGPLAMGASTIFHQDGFTVDSTYDTIIEYGVTNLAGSPTAYRMLVGGGSEKAARVRGQLRAVSSAGEPLNPEIIRWFDRHLQAPIRDHYGQTEVGMVLCNHHAFDHPVRIGSAGYPSPGYRIAVLSPDGRELGIGEAGELALDVTASPMMWFGGYHERDTPSLQGSYYLSGDTVEWNDDGSISFVGRADDVITTSGYRVGPFDVESALIEHEAVLESAVIGKPDPQRTEIIKAFVVLNAGFEPDSELAEALRRHVKTRLSAHAYPREIEFVADLPKTPSGKLQRFLLRANEAAAAPTSNSS
ncbi:AMP-binding protein [Sphingomonas tabacisoli]|uniref:AMP-binding protein n=1 Tax=Sphingomonas tabacisoli TaxID=2249466 RepID=A0ABW4I6U0_9SPHN